MKNEEKLEKLINSSSSLSDDEKKMIIDSISTFNDEQILGAIEILELEQEKWEELRKDDEASLEMFDNYVEESNKDIEKEYKNTISNIEERKSQEESNEADNLLKNI